MSDPRTMGEALITKVRETVELDNFNANYRTQANLLFMIASGWETFTLEVQTELRHLACVHIPRLSEVANPERAFEEILKLYTISPSHAKSDINKSIKSFYNSKTYIPDPEDALFPKDGWIGRFMDYAKHSEVPVAFHFWAAVTVLGSACKYKVYIDRGKFDLRMNWYTMLTGDKATGKSVSKDIAEDVVNRANRMIAGAKFLGGSYSAEEIRIIGEDSTKEAIIEQLAARNDAVPTEHGTVRVEVRDSTGVIFVDELANLLGRQTFNVESKIPFFTALYGSKFYRKHTKTAGDSELRNCALSMLTCCAPGWLLESITPIMFTGGFLDRFRIIYRPPNHSPRVYPKAWPGDPVLANLLAEDLIPWMKLTEEFEIMIDEEAEEWFEKWYLRTREKIQANAYHKALSLHRLSNMLIRLSGILAISDNSAPYIHTKHLQMSARILDYEEGMFAQLMMKVTEAPESNNLDEIYDIIVSANGVITVTDMHKALRRKKGFVPLKTRGLVYIEDLVSMGHLAIVANTKGRKTKYYVLTQEGLEYLEDNHPKAAKLGTARMVIFRFSEDLAPVERGRLGNVTIHSDEEDEHEGRHDEVLEHYEDSNSSSGKS